MMAQKRILVYPISIEHEMYNAYVEYLKKELGSTLPTWEQLPTAAQEAWHRVLLVARKVKE